MWEAGVATAPRASVDVQPATGVDAAGGWHLVHVEHRVTDEVRFDASTWEPAVAAGQRAVGHEIAGACRAMLDLARQHALDRVQFGRPIVSFQAVRHRLAEVLVAIEALEATLGAAADDPGPETAALAKATAGRAARVTATHCQQVLAGIGFTTDHPFHGYLKRTMVLSGLLGTADAIAVDLGRQLLEARRVPTLIEL
jgi:alkylation response protein AidB-like acyl-CoA dehydrogenase